MAGVEVAFTPTWLAAGAGEEDSGMAEAGTGVTWTRRQGAPRSAAAPGAGREAGLGSEPGETFANSDPAPPAPSPGPEEALPSLLLSTGSLTFILLLRNSVSERSASSLTVVLVLGVLRSKAGAVLGLSGLGDWR